MSSQMRLRHFPTCFSRVLASSFPELMQFHMFAIQQALKIFKTIVSSIAIDVMNVMTCRDRTIGRFPNKSMFKNAAIVVRLSFVALMIMASAWRGMVHRERITIDTVGSIVSFAHSLTAHFALAVVHGADNTIPCFRRCAQHDRRIAMPPEAEVMLFTKALPVANAAAFMNRTDRASHSAHYDTA